MNQYNLFKIEHAEVPLLKENLVANGLTLSDNSPITSGQFNYSFYISRNPDKVTPKWSLLYANLIGTDQVENIINYGALVIESESLCYAVSVGKSHFYIKPFCVEGFGLHLAERICKAGNIKMLNSKFFKSKRSKSITSFIPNTEFGSSAGEAITRISSLTINPDVWGKSAEFGDSAKFNLEIAPLELGDLIDKIEDKLEEEAIINIPRIEPILEAEKIEQLQAELVECIEDQNNTNTTLNTSQFLQSGVDIIFTAQAQYSLYLKGNRNDKYELDELSIESLRTYVQEKGIDLSTRIDEINVIIQRDGERGFTKPLLELLEFINNENHCLYEGKWYRFNQSFIKYITEEVDKLEPIHLSEFDFNPKIEEGEFNRNKEANGFKVIDTKLTPIEYRFKIEPTDLYKDHTFYHVKKGGPQKLNYVIDQAITSLRWLKENNLSLPLGGTGRRPKIKNIALWLLLKRSTQISRLSELNSLTFLIKLTQFRAECFDANLTPQVYVNYPFSA